MDQGTLDPIQSLTEEVKKLQEIVAENNTVLKGIQRRGRLVVLASSLKWIVIIGLSLGSFYFLKPLLDTYKSLGFGQVLEHTLGSEMTGSEQE